MKIHYDTFGTGRTFVWLHGLLESNQIYVNMAKQIPGQHYLVDSRNHAKSPRSQDMSHEAHIEDIEEFFKQSRIEKATLISYSAGGRTSCGFVTKRPELVERLVVMEAVPVDYNRWNTGWLDEIQEVLDSAASID